MREELYVILNRTNGTQVWNMASIVPFDKQAIVRMIESRRHDPYYKGIEMAIARLTILPEARS